MSRHLFLYSVSSAFDLDLDLGGFSFFPPFYMKLILIFID